MVEKTDIHRASHLALLARGAGIMFVFTLVGFILTFLFKVTAARYFGPQDFGLYELVQTIFGVTMIIASLGISESMYYYIPVFRQKKDWPALNGYLVFSFGLPFLFSLVILGLIFVFSDIFLSSFNVPAEFTSLVLAAMIALPVKMISTALRRYFIATRDFLSPALAYNVIENVILLGGIFFIVWLKLSVLWLVVVFILSIFLSTTYDLFIYRRTFRLHSYSFNFWLPEWFSYSLPLLFTGVFSFLMRWTDNLVLGSVLDASAVGIYSVAYSFSAFLLFFRSSFETAFLPLISERVSEGDSSTTNFLFQKSQAWIFGLSFPLALVLMFFSKQIIGLLYGSDYIAGSPSLIILVCGFIIFVFFGLAKAVLLAHKRTGFLFKVTLMLGVLNLVVNIALINVFGILGAAVSTGLIIALEGIIVFWKASSLEHLSFDLSRNVRFMSSGLSSLIIVSIIYYLLPLSGVWLAIIALLFFGFSFFAFLIMYNAFDQSDVFIIEAIEKKMDVDLSFIKRRIKKL